MRGCKARCRLLGAAALWLAIGATGAQAKGPTDEASMPAVEGEVPVRARLAADVVSLPREGNAQLALVLQMGPGWHVYALEPGAIGAPTRLTLSSGNAHIGALEVPPPQHFSQLDGAQALGYSNTLTARAPIEVSDSVGDHLDVDAEVQLLACKVLCVPGRLKLHKRLPVTSEKQMATADELSGVFAPTSLERGAPPDVVAPQAASASLAFMLLFALLGGLVLNVMPCVLPVLVMKAAGVVAAGSDGPTRRRHALGYALGTIGSMLVLGCVVIGLRAAGQAAGWGFQMQQPAFLAALTVALTLFCLHAFDVFVLSAPLGALSARHASSTGIGKSVLEGVLAVLVATPCSAPLLGTATAFALAQPAPVTLLAFAAIGAGLALPFVAIALWPGRRGWLPRPGAWMGAVKSTLAFALFGTVLWLVWLYAAVAGHAALVGLLVLLWASTLGAFLLGATSRVWPEHGAKRFALLLALLVVLGDGLSVFFPGPPPSVRPSASTQGPLVWAPWSPEAVAKALAAQRPVLVEFTADWCVTCQYNERVLRAPAIEAALTQRHVQLLRADWTRPDEAILAELTRRGRVGVPMTLVFDPHAPSAPQRLPEVLSEQKLLEVLGRL